MRFGRFLLMALIAAAAASCGQVPSAGLVSAADVPGKPATKITSALRASLRRLEGPAPAEGGLIAGAPVRLDGEGRMEIYIYVDAVTPERLEALRERGAKVGLYDPQQGLVQAHIKPAAVEGLAELPFVRRLDLPIRGHVNRPETPPKP